MDDLIALPPEDETEARSSETEISRPGLLSTADQILKVLALFALLTAGLGYPAVIVEFHRHGIPSVFIDKELAAQAGVVPAGALVLIAALLYWLARFILKQKDEGLRNFVRDRNAAKVYVFLVLWILVPGILQNPIAKRAIAALGQIPRLPGIPSHIEQPARWIIVLLISGLPVILIDLIPAFFLTRRRMKKAKRIDEVWWSRFWPVYRKTWNFLSSLTAITILNLTWIVLAIPLAFFALYTDYIFRGVHGPSWLVTDNQYEALPPLMFWSAFSFFFAVLEDCYAGSELDRNQARKPQWKFKIAAMIFGYLPSAVLYTVYGFPMIPASLGGGKPAAADVWLEKDALPASATSKLKRLRLTKESERLYLDKCFLIHVNSDVIVLSDSDEPYAAAVVLPRDAVKAISSPR
jgi:hypothetical protein